jgi:hypothetical protein
MTTRTDTVGTANTPAYSVSVWDIVPGLLWATFALGVLACWLWARKLAFGPTLYLVTGALAAVSLAFFAWASVRRFKAKDDAGQLAAFERQLRPILSIACLAAAGVLFVLAACLYFAEDQKLEAFAEISSLAVMGFICIGAGESLRLTSESRWSRQKLLELLVRVRPHLGVTLIVVGVLLGILGGYFLYRAGRIEFFQRFPGGPEGLGCLLIGVTFALGGLWLQVTMDRPATSDSIRILVLLVGSVTGLMVTLFTALRVWGWWTTYLSGGMRSWQGPEGWRFWLCAYVGLFGLFLIFGSLLLARADVRTNVAKRRLLYGYNAFLTGVLLLAVIVIMNIMVYVQLPSNVEWNQTYGLQSLSGRSKQVLEGLKDKVTVYLLMGHGTVTYLEVRDLLDNCQSVTDKLTVTELSPDMNDDEYRKLSKLYPELDERSPGGPPGKGAGRGLLVVYGRGAAGTKLPHVLISENDLEDFDQRTMKRVYSGERILMQNIRQLVEGEANKPKVYFTQGNGELWINDADLSGLAPNERILRPGGAGEVVSLLKKDNFEVQGLIWEAKPPQMPAMDAFAFSQSTPKSPHEVPDDCRILVIANPDKAFSKEVLEAIDRYMDKRNGKLMVLTHTGILRNGRIAEDGMEEFCKKYNVQVTNDFIMRQAPGQKVMEMLQVKATVPPQPANAVARQFLDRRFYFLLPRTVTPVKSAENYQADTILHVTEPANGRFWAENNVAAVMGDPRDFVQDMLALGKLNFAANPLPVGAAVTDRDNKPRAMVFGDYTFISTTIQRTSPDASDYYDFFRSCLTWLAERNVDDIGISPKESGVYRPKDDISLSRLIWLPIGLMVLGLAGMGAGIWVVRRK